MKSSLSRDSSITFVTRTLIMVLAVVDTIIISRALGPSLTGSFRIVLLVANAASLFFLFGLGSANVYFGARQPSALPALTGNSFLAAFLFGALGVLAVELATFVPGFRSYLLENNVDIRWVRVVILFLPLVQLRVLLGEIVRAKGDILRYNLVAGWQVLIGLAGTISLVWLLNMGIDGAINAWIVGQAGAAAIVMGMALRMVEMPLRIDLESLRRSVVFGFKVYVGNVAQFLNYRLDIFFVALFLTPAAVGFYTTATALAEIMWGIPNAIRTVLLYQVAASEQETAARMTARVSRITTLLIALICLFTAALSYQLIGLLYGEPFLPAAPALLALIPGIWTLSVGKLLSAHLVGSGRPEVTSFSALVSLVLTVVLDVLLIPTMGIVGAAIASSVSYTVSTLVFAAVFLRDTDLKMADLIWLRREDLVMMRQAAVNWWRARTAARTLSKGR